MMINSGRYLVLADHAEGHANEAVDPQLRAVLSRVAAQWRGLAELITSIEAGLNIVPGTTGTR